MKHLKLLLLPILAQLLVGCAITNPDHNVLKLYAPPGLMIENRFGERPKVLSCQDSLYRLNLNPDRDVTLLLTLGREQFTVFPMQQVSQWRPNFGGWLLQAFLHDTTSIWYEYRDIHLDVPNHKVYYDEVPNTLIGHDVEEDYVSYSDSLFNRDAPKDFSGLLELAVGYTPARKGLSNFDVPLMEIGLGLSCKEKVGLEYAFGVALHDVILAMLDSSYVPDHPMISHTVMMTVHAYKDSYLTAGYLAGYGYVKDSPDLWGVRAEARSSVMLYSDPFLGVGLRNKTFFVEIAKRFPAAAYQPIDAWDAWKESIMIRSGVRFAFNSR